MIPTSFYEFAASYSSVDQLLVASATNTIMSIILVPLLIAGTISVFMIICMWLIYKKAGKGGWESIVPVYNFIVMLQITDLPMWYIALLFVPFAQIYVMIKMNIELAKKFGQEGGFAALLILVPVVGYPILAFDKNKVYMGMWQNVSNGFAQPQYQAQSTYSQQPYAQPAFQQPVQPQQQFQSQTAGQPIVSQPVQPMTAQPPKAPMDPAKKKTVITWCCVGGGVVLLGIIAAIVLPIILRVDYSTAYNMAKELKPKIYEIYQSYDCEHVVDYLDSTYTSAKTYNEYVEGCKSSFDQSTAALIDKLGDADGVTRDENIKEQFATFKAAYESAIPESETLYSKLEIYAARHSFVVAADDLSYSSSDAEITAAAKHLIDSGNETLKTYGEGWLEKYLVAAHAYQDWYNSTGYFGEKYDLKNSTDTERKNWVAANKPDIKSAYPLNFNNTPKMYSEFNKLYELIRTTYEKNYNHDSGDCVEFLGEVICD